MNISKLSDGQREGTICSKSLFSQINLKGKNSPKLVFTCVANNKLRALTDKNRFNQTARFNNSRLQKDKNVTSANR